MNYKELLNQLKQGELDNLYLLYGDEDFLIEKALQEIVTRVVDPNFKDFNFDLIEGDKSIKAGTIRDLANTPPLMTECRLVIAKEVDKLPIDEQRILSAYLASLPSTTCLVLTAQGMDKRTRLFSALKKKGQVIKFDPLNSRQLPSWIKEEVRRLKKKIDNEAIHYLAEAIGNNLRQLHTEIEKLASYIGDREKMEIEDVKSAVDISRGYLIFDLLDALGERRKDEALFLLSKMIETGEPEIKILYMIVRQIRLILQAKLLKASGESNSQIVSTLGQHPYTIKKCLDQGAKFSLAELYKAMEDLFTVELKVKTGRLPWKLALEMLIIELSEVENRVVK